MQNPFSNRNTITAGDYTEQKRNLTKITFLKNNPLDFFRTQNYIVQPNCDLEENEIHKTPYPKENCLPNTLYFFLPYEQHDLFLNYYNEDHKSKHVKTSIDLQIKKKCKKCSNTIFLMKYPPAEWVCDGWDPPNSHCKGYPNGEKLNRTHEAFACPNHRHCNWIICKKCYEYLNKEEEPAEEVGEEEFISEEISYEDLIEQERKDAIEQEILESRKKAPYLKCIRNYKEYLDLAKGFHLTEPLCENAYPDICENGKNGKLVNNISEAKYAVLDMGKECLYESEEVKKCNCGKCAICKKPKKTSLKINKCRMEKGLINLRGTITPKLKTENIFKFPITLKKTYFCNKKVEHTSQPDIHNIHPNKLHTHWFPTNRNFTTYTHQHAGKQQFHSRPYNCGKKERAIRQTPYIAPHNKPGCAVQNNFPRHPFNNMGKLFSMPTAKTIVKLPPRHIPKRVVRENHLKFAFKRNIFL